MSTVLFADIATFRNGVNFLRTDHGTATKIIGVGDFLQREVIESTSALGEVILSRAPRPDDYLEPDDLLFVRSNGSKSLVGRCVVYRGAPLRATFSGFTIRARITSEFMDAHYVAAAVRSPLFRDHLKRLGGGSSITNLSQAALGKFELWAPALPEQRKIADILGTWDDAIDALGVSAINKRVRRELLIDQVVFPAGKPHGLSMDRVPSGWRVQQISDVAAEVSTRNRKLEATVVLTCSKHRGFVRNTDYFDRSTQGSDLSDYKIIHRDQFGFPSNHVEEGSIGVQNVVDVGIVSPIYTVFEFGEQVDPQFAYLVLKTNSYRHMFEVSTSASVARRGSLRWRDFAKLRFPVPPIGEQRAIVRAIASVDHEIALLDRQIALLKQQKRGLMQKLLTGDIRVTVDPTEEVTR